MADRNEKNFEVVPGQRHSAMLVKFGDKLYRRDKISAGSCIEYLKCRNAHAPKNCRARGLIKNNVFEMYSGTHTCGDNIDTIEAFLVSNKLKKEALTTSMPLQALYNSHLHEPGLTFLPFSKVNRSMMRSRERRYPTNVRDPQAIIDYMSNPLSALEVVELFHAGVTCDIEGNGH